MNPNLHSLPLPDDVYSPDQMSVAILELSDYQNALRDALVHTTAGSKKPTETPEPSAHLASLASSANIDLQNAAALDTLRKQLELLLRKAPVAHITLAAVPSLTIKRKLVAWFRQEISPYMLLTFTARTDLGGGIVVQAGSHLYDFSFKRQLLANKQKITEIAQRVR